MFPSVLVELGYVSNREDLRSLMSDTWRDRTANSIAKAIDTYLTTRIAGMNADANQGSAVQNGLSLNKKPSDHSP